MATRGFGARLESVQWTIDSIQPNYIYHLCAVPDDPYWSLQWDMTLINMPTAWDITKGDPITGGNPVVVAVVDSGVAQHPDLVDRLLTGYDFVANVSGGNNDQVGHGTHVAGTIGAQGDNSVGICGVCWDSVRILPVRVMDANGYAPESTILEGLDYAMQQGAQVVNMSFGAQPGVQDPAEHMEIQKLAAANIVLVAAAGNDSSGGVLAPAIYPEVISVGAVGSQGEISYFSSYGPGDLVTLAAPGGDDTVGGDAGLVYSTWVIWTGATPTYGYAYDEGTSMACPHVAGAAALLLSYGCSPREVRTRLTESATIPAMGYDETKYGAGILNVAGALGSYIQIVKPAKGSTVVNGAPTFQVNVGGVDISSIKVYIDYPDENGDGVPDSPTAPTVIDSSNINIYINSTSTQINFTWPLSGYTALTPGTHFMYVSGNSIVNGSLISDWEAFTVASQVIPAGIHLFALPYAISNTTVAPSNLFSGADFSLTSSLQSALWRWIAAPLAVDTFNQIGYEQYVPGDSTDLAWSNTLYDPGNGIPVVVGGGYYVDSNSGATRFAFPAGTGFWLILPRDVAINTNYSSFVLDSLSNVDESKGFTIPLYKGLELIGNPYAHSVPSWAALQFNYHGTTMGFTDATLAGWVNAAIYGYTPGAGYVDISEASNTLDPYNGYWIRALVGGAGPGEALTMTILP